MLSNRQLCCIVSFQSLRQQSYDHHAAIYFLLLERLRQHRPGSHRYAGSSTGGPGHGAVRMMSTDSTTCRRAPRRPSTVAEHAMRKMIPGNGPENTLPATPSQGAASGNYASSMYMYTIVHLQFKRCVNCEGIVVAAQEHAYWKANRPRCGPSQTSSVDEGVADMDSTWDPDPSGSAATMGHGSSISSGMGASNVSASSTSGPRSRADWKWPARGSSGSSAQISSDLSQVGRSLENVLTLRNNNK